MKLETTKDIAQCHLEDLYGSVSWVSYTKNPELLQKAVRNSSHVATYWDEGILVALLRCISDDATIAYVQDILVRPSHQRIGLGSKLLNQCLARFSHVRQFVLLTDDSEEQRKFYESLGLSNIKTFGRGSLNTFVKITES